MPLQDQVPVLLKYVPFMYLLLKMGNDGTDILVSILFAYDDKDDCFLNAFPTNLLRSKLLIGNLPFGNL
jgi:hypothetical protein